MLKRILVVAITLLIVWCIYFATKTLRGARMKYGPIGLMLVLLPNALNLLIFPADRVYFATLCATSLAGVLVLIWDVTSKPGK
jgi:hypothetical protein